MQMMLKYNYYVNIQLRHQTHAVSFNGGDRFYTGYVTRCIPFLLNLYWREQGKDGEEDLVRTAKRRHEWGSMRADRPTATYVN